MLVNFNAQHASASQVRSFYDRAPESPVLKRDERVPRWPTTFEVAKRAVGVVILLLAIVLLLTPVPLSNVAFALVISLISVAYVEEDGLLLSAAFLVAIILIGIGSAAVWGTIVGAILIST